MQEITPIKWEDANFKWNDNSYTGDEVQLVIEVISGPGEFDEELYKSKILNMMPMRLIMFT